MNPIIVAGSGNPPLADSVAERLGARVCRAILDRFPDTELHVEIDESVRGCDVYLIQPTEGSEDRRRLDDPLRQFREKMEIIRQFETVEPRCSEGGARLAVSFVDEN